MSHSHFDVIVAGVGSMGSAACWQLAERGKKVLGIEKFALGHDLGSHGGQSRIIRMAYFEHEDYVPLLKRAYNLWHDLETVSRQQVYYRTGLLYLGQPNSVLLQGVQRSAEMFDVPVYPVEEAEFAEKYPMFHLPAGCEALLEPYAGFLTPERAVNLMALEAMEDGAVIHAGEALVEWHIQDNKVMVTTTDGAYSTDKLIITSGAWAPKLLPQLSSKLKVTRQTLAWMWPQDQELFELYKFPCWMMDDAAGIMYGFPMLEQSAFGGHAGLKIARHLAGDETDPDQVNRAVTSADKQPVLDFVKKFMPDANGPATAWKTCLYTYSPDEHFIVDFLPESAGKVLIATGFSGHGFKFAPVIGEILADLAITGSTPLPIDFLRLKRFV